VGKDYEGDYQFGEAGQFDKMFRGLNDRMKSDRLRPLAETFQLNLERVVSMNALPIELIHWASFITRVHCTARIMKGLPPSDEVQDQIPELAVTIDAISAQMLKEYGFDGAATNVAHNIPAANRIWSDGTRFLKVFLRRLIEHQRPTDEIQTREYLTGGVEAILSSMVVLSYAAFETLSADLWVIAVNSDSRLATNWASKNPKKELRMEDLIGHNFNLSQSMGTALFQTQKVSFNSLNDIINNYNSAFFGAADGCFEPRSELVEAEKVRHLFAHRGGVVDAKFIREMAGNPSYSQIVEGQRLPITGPSVCQHVDACVKSGTKVIEFVDRWLSEPFDGGS
jgi:hypothetical protein